MQNLWAYLKKNNRQFRLKLGNLVNKESNFGNNHTKFKTFAKIKTFEHNVQKFYSFRYWFLFFHPPLTTCGTHRPSV